MASKKAVQKKVANKSAKKAAKKATKKAPPKASKKVVKKAAVRTSARGAQPKSKMSGRTKTERGAKATQKPRSKARSAAQAPQRKVGVERPGKPKTEKRRDRSAKRVQPRRDDSQDRMMEMPPATREEREQRPQFTQDAEARPQFGGGHEDGQQQSAETPEDEGYGRSAGADNQRLGQSGEYAADDDELHYGRNLGGRNRIPGGGSRRNR